MSVGSEEQEMIGPFTEEQVYDAACSLEGEIEQIASEGNLYARMDVEYVEKDGRVFLAAMVEQLFELTANGVVQVFGEQIDFSEAKQLI